MGIFVKGTVVASGILAAALFGGVGMASASPTSTVSVQSGSTVRDNPVGPSTMAAKVTGSNATGLVPTLPSEMEAKVSNGSSFGKQRDKGGNLTYRNGTWFFTADTGVIQAAS